MVLHFIAAGVPDTPVTLTFPFLHQKGRKRDREPDLIFKDRPIDTINVEVHLYMYLPFSGDGSGRMTIRGCALDSGTLTTDTEITRMSHCGSFYYNEK